MASGIVLAAALKVLAIGNSFSASLGPYFGEVARAAGCEVDFCAVSIGGCTLERHVKEIGISETNSVHAGCWALWTYASEGWTRHPKWADRVCRGDGKALNELDALRAEKWDVVTIQQASQSSWRPETFEPWATKLIDVIRREAPQAEIVIQETWSYNSREEHVNDGAGRKGAWNIDNAEMYRHLSENYRRLSAEHGNLRIIPTGTAVENFRRSLGAYDSAKDVVGWDRKRDGKTFYDGVHLNPDGQYLQALVWTAKLFNKDISSVEFVPPHLKDRPERVEAIKNAVTAAVECGVAVPSAADEQFDVSTRYIQRTMKKLSESTAEHPATVRMLFYGQSIVEQGWSEEMTLCLRRRYPTVRFEVENKAIGGFESPLLVRAAEADLYPAYADIVFFQDYGPTELVRTMIERLRARTTSEIVMWTSHVHRKEAAASSLEELSREGDARSRDLVSIAADNHCLIVHLRRTWCEKLLANGWTADHYLDKDGNHLNRDSGAFEFYAETIAAALVRMDGVGPDSASGTVTDYPCTWSLGGAGYVKNADGSVDFEFTGNRVEMQFRPRCNYGTSPFVVLLDGKQLSSHRELFHHGRVSNLVSWMPLVLHVGANTLPLAETWKLTFLDGTSPDGKPIRYRVDGSRTGFDGEGRSDLDFVSNSGRVTIKASDFHVWQYDYFVKSKKNEALAAKPGQWVAWQTFADFQEDFDGYQPDDRPVVVLSGCANAKHRLTIVPTIPSRLPLVEKLTVYCPSGKNVGETPVERAFAAKRTPVNPDFDPNVGRSRSE